MDELLAIEQNKVEELAAVQRALEVERGHTLELTNRLFELGGLDDGATQQAELAASAAVGSAANKRRRGPGDRPDEDADAVLTNPQWCEVSFMRLCYMTM